MPRWTAGNKVAIAWGSARGGQTAVVFEACSDSRARWFANAGGFYLDASSMCVRLLVKFGKRTTIVRTGIRTGCE